MTSFVDKIGQSGSKSLEQTLDSNPGPQSFMDYTINSIKIINDKLTEKHDLSKPQDGFIIHQRLVTPEFAASRTGEAFIESITKNKHNKVWEYFVFVAEVSDTIPAASIEQTDIYAQIKKAESDYRLDPKKKLEGSMKKKFDDFFKGSEKQDFIDTMNNYLLSAIRFYGVSSSSPGNGVRKCKVLFHDVGNLQYGKMISIGSLLEHEYSNSLESRIRDALKEFDIQSSSVTKDKTNAKKNKLSEQAKQQESI